MSDIQHRECVECGETFEFRGGTCPPKICSDECRRLRQIETVRRYRRRRTAEMARLRAIVAQLEQAVAA